MKIKLNKKDYIALKKYLKNKVCKEIDGLSKKVLDNIANGEDKYVVEVEISHECPWEEEMSKDVELISLD